MYISGKLIVKVEGVDNPADVTVTMTFEDEGGGVHQLGTMTPTGPESSVEFEPVALLFAGTFNTAGQKVVEPEKSEKHKEEKPAPTPAPESPRSTVHPPGKR